MKLWYILLLKNLIIKNNYKMYLVRIMNVINDLVFTDTHDLYIIDRCQYSIYYLNYI